MLCLDSSIARLSGLAESHRIQVMRANLVSTGVRIEADLLAYCTGHRDDQMQRRDSLNRFLHDQTMLLKIAADQGKPLVRSWGTDASARWAMTVDLRRRADQAGTRRIVLAYEACGFGFRLHDELTAMVYLTEMGDLSRFANRQPVGSFLGLVPSSFETGKDDDHKGHITRQGPTRARKVLCQAVGSRLRCVESERRAYDRVVQRNPKHKKIAVVARMRVLAVTLWHEGFAAQEGMRTVAVPA
ncbi:MAG: transposase [Planctomycetota bacterium]